MKHGAYISWASATGISPVWFITMRVVHDSLVGLSSRCNVCKAMLKSCVPSMENGCKMHRKSIEMTPLVVRGRLEMPRRYSSGSRGAQETPKSAPGGTQEQARSALERHKSIPEPLGCPFGRHGGSHWRPQGITKASFAGTWPHEGAQKVVQVRVPKRSREWKRKWILKWVHFESPVPQETRSRIDGVRFARKRHVREHVVKRDQQISRSRRQSGARRDP